MLLSSGSHATAPIAARGGRSRRQCQRPNAAACEWGCCDREGACAGAGTGRVCGRKCETSTCCRRCRRCRRRRPAIRHVADGSLLPASISSVQCSDLSRLRYPSDASSSHTLLPTDLRDLCSHLQQPPGRWRGSEKLAGLRQASVTTGGGNHPIGGVPERRQGERSWRQTVSRSSVLASLLMPSMPTCPQETPRAGSSATGRCPASCRVSRAGCLQAPPRRGRPAAGI